MNKKNGLSRRKTLIGAATAALAAAAGKSAASAQRAEPILELHDGMVHLPAHTISPPTSISEQARNYLRKGADRPYVAPPDVKDTAAWHKAIDARAREVEALFGPIEIFPGFPVETITMNGVTVYKVRPDKEPADSRKVHIFIHGGGWVQHSGKMARILAKIVAMQFGGTVYGVDYRTPPDHPFPAPLDDCLAVYKELLRNHAPNEILVSGESAGGNLAAALMHKVRDTGLPAPAALFLNTPATDLTGASDTLQTNQGVDVLLKVYSRNNAELYAGGADIKHPYLSPLLGDLSKGFPPTYLRTGTRDLMLSDTVRMHAALRKAGVEADLYVCEAMPHAGLGGRTPEDADARADTVRWLNKHWPRN